MDLTRALFEESRRNIITGLGLPPLKPEGKRSGSQISSQFVHERDIDARKRMADGRFRFYDDSCIPVRRELKVVCESAIIGFPNGRKRNLMKSCGILDNFGHLQSDLPVNTSLPNRRNLSQIILA